MLAGVYLQLIAYALEEGHRLNGSGNGPRVLVETLCVGFVARVMRKTMVHSWREGKRGSLLRRQGGAGDDRKGR